jgi:hypothetical protein
VGAAIYLVYPLYPRVGYMSQVLASFGGSTGTVTDVRKCDATSNDTLRGGTLLIMRLQHPKVQRAPGPLQQHNGVQELL